MSMRPKVAARVRPAPTALSIALLAVAACDKPQASAPQAAATPAASAPPADDMRPMKEFWPNGQLKFFNEMRRGADGKWGKNGLGRAYYQNGTLEREGRYRDGVRVGVWTYYNPDGSLNRTENRGG
jgi:hypothetical protein